MQLQNKHTKELEYLSMDIITLLDKNLFLQEVIDKKVFDSFHPNGTILDIKINVLGESIDSDKFKIEEPEDETKVIIELSYKLKEFYFKLSEISKILGNESENSFKNIFLIIEKYLKELSIILTSKKYKCSIEEAKNRLEYSNHYKNIVQNDAKLLELFNKTKEYFENAVKEKNLDRNNLVTKKEHFFHDETKPADTAASFHIIFQINKNCNFKCTYCYEGLDKVTEIITLEDIPEFVKGIKKFQEHLKETGRVSKLSFSILGGEPTLVSSKKTQLLTYLLNTELDLKYIILITNNYDSKKTMNFFHPEFPKDKIKIQVSYDGGVIQENYRKDSKKQGTLELLKREIKALLNQGYRISLKATLPIEATKDIPSAVMDYVSLEEEINTNNGSGQNFSYYPTFDNTSLLMYQLRQDKLYGGDKSAKLFKDIDTVFEFLLKFEIDRLLNGDPAFTRWFREMSYTANNTACGAGVSLLSIDQDGESRYCHRTEFNNEFTKNKSIYKKEEYDKLFYGHVNDDNFAERFEKTRDIILSEETSKDISNFSYCSSCKTLSCVKCPMVNITPDRVLDTTSSQKLFVDMQSHGLSLSCEINNRISVYLYMFDKIINK